MSSAVTTTPPPLPQAGRGAVAVHPLQHPQPLLSPSAFPGGQHLGLGSADSIRGSWGVPGRREMPLHSLTPLSSAVTGLGSAGKCPPQLLRAQLDSHSLYFPSHNSLLPVYSQW